MFPEPGDFLKSLVLSFIPLFIAMGAFDFLPVILAMTKGMEEKRRKKAMRDGSVAAALILITFLFVGKLVFVLLGVSDSDFLIAGGLLLLILSIKALLIDPDAKRTLLKEFAIVPLATPLIAGPAAMATTVILLNSYGPLVTLASILLNCLVTWLILDKAPLLGRLLGERGTQALSKVSYILLASIAVMMIRHGVQMIR